MNGELNPLFYSSVGYGLGARKNERTNLGIVGLAESSGQSGGTVRDRARRAVDIRYAERSGMGEVVGSGSRALLRGDASVRQRRTVVHQAIRADAADALWRELARGATGEE